MKTPKDLFAEVPEFLAAFDNILNNGFFEELKFDVGGRMTEGLVGGCSINAAGYIPNHTKYAAEGCGAVIDPTTIIASCRALAKRKKVKCVMTKVETADWQLYAANDEDVIGSKGKRVELHLYVTFKP